MRALVVTLLALLVVAPAAATPPPLPHGWPKTMQIGLAGGVNTGQGWSTWNPDGTFASMYVQDSWSHGTIPVLTYYMLLQSNPKGGDEAQADLAHLRDPQVM